MSYLNNSRNLTTRPRAGWSSALLILSALLAPPALVQAQFTYTTNSGAITITGYNPAAGLKVVIPASINGHPVTAIGTNAFYFLATITNVAIPNSVASIGDFAFEECFSLASVTIGNSVTNIGEGAFVLCNGLTRVTIPDSVTSIGDGAFTGCSRLTNIAVNAASPNYASLGGALFDKSLDTLLQFPGGLGGSYAIPDSVANIGDAFEGCSLTSVTIPNSVTSIGEDAFDGCPGLTSVTIPNSVTSLGYESFAFCYGLTNVTIGNSVTNIGDNAFEGSVLTSVTIPNSVTSIGGFAFASSSGLTSVTIGDSVTNIGEEAFEECSRLTNIAVNAVNPYYASSDGALFDKSLNTLIQVPGGLAGSYAIPGSVTSIGVRAFVGCSVLTSVTIPDSVTSIGDYAFADCYILTSVTIGNSVTSIGEGAFEDCYVLTSATIPDSVTSIGDYAFFDCSGLTNITIPNSVTNIGQSAFVFCDGLTSVTIPDSVASIGDQAFASAGLTNIAVNAANPNYASVGGALFDKSLDTLLQFPGGLAGSYAIPDSVTNIGDAFENCSLTSVTIPDSITSIGEDAFEGCTLTSVTIPDSVTNIGDGAFASCRGLTSVTIGDSVTSIGESAFAFCYGLNQAYFQGNAPLVAGAAGSADSTVFQGESGTVYYYASATGWGSTYGGWPTVELDAPPQIGGGGGIGIQSGNFGFIITGVTNQTVVVEASTNLVNWQPIWTNTLSGASTNFTDSLWKNFPNRFYRAR